MRTEPFLDRHHALLEKLGLGLWTEYDASILGRALVERSPKHLKDWTYDIAGLSITCYSGIYHPDVNSSSMFILRHLLDQALFPTPPENILEIGTGCGAIILALRQFLGTGQYTAVDIDPASIRCAEANAARNGAPIRFLESDLFSAVPGERYQTVIFNLPLYAGPVDTGLAPELHGKLCDYRGELLERFMTELPKHLSDNGCAYLAVSNTGYLAALDHPDFHIEVIAFERFLTGFMRILIRLEYRGIAA